jgi:hypothetical protein
MLRHNTAPLKRKNKLSVMPTPSERTPAIMKNLLGRLNLIKPVCNSMFGREHSLGHRVFTGAVVAVIGVVISKALGHHQMHVVAYAGDAIGYGLHGLGVAPFIEWLAKTYEEM